MSKLSDLFKAKERTLDALTPSETALHALNVDDGIITYTKIKWDSEETVDMTDGSGFAYQGVEEFVAGITASGIEHNLIKTGVSEVGEKNLVGGDFHITVANTTTNPQFVVDGVFNGGMTCIRGAKYRFIVSDQSTQGFPFHLSTTANGVNFLHEYLDGVNNSRTCSGGEGVDPNAQTDQPLEFLVPDDAPDTLYISAGHHANCYGVISIEDRDEATNLKHRKYDQVRFDNQKLTYYMNADGFLVARYGQDYNYS